MSVSLKSAILTICEVAINRELNLIAAVIVQH